MVRSALLIGFWCVAAPALASGQDVAQFFMRIDGQDRSPLCLTMHDANHDRLAEARIVVSGTLDGGARDARMSLRLANGKATFRFGLECRVAGPGGKLIECSIPCGDGVSVNLAVGKDGSVKADLDVADGVLGKAGAIRSTITMQSDEASACQPKSDDEKS